MKLSKKELDNKILALIEADKKAKELAKQVKMLKDELKDVMDKHGVDELRGNKLYCYYKEVEKHVIDNDMLRADNLYNKYLKLQVQKNFNYNVIK